MRRTLAKWLLVVGVGAMALLAQGCKRHAAPAPTPVAAPRVAPEPRFEPFPSDAGAVRDTGPAAAVRHRRRENLPVVTPAPVVQETEAEAEARQREQDAGLLRQQEAASRRIPLSVTNCKSDRVSLSPRQFGTKDAI